MWTCVFKNTYKKKYNNNKKNTYRSLESKNIILRMFFSECWGIASIYLCFKFIYTDYD